MPSFEYENQYPANQHVVGIDEVGCGPWAGPLVAIACSFDRINVPYKILALLNDSKKLTKQKRETAFQALMEENNKTFFYAIGIVEIDLFNELNLKNALPLIMQKAFNAFPKQAHHILVDGIRNPNIPLPTTLIKKGDSISYTIAAASIVAKVTRDKIMEELHNIFPQYGWKANAGYGTKTHQDAIKIFGLTPHHRTCFTPIKNFLALKKPEFI
jgi:ribonuclease HII